MPFHGLALDDDQVGIQRPGGGHYISDRTLGAAARASEQREEVRVVLTERTIHECTWLLTQRADFGIACDADDGVDGGIAAERAADRVQVRPEALRHHFIDHDGFVRAGPVNRVTEIAPAYERDAGRVKEARIHSGPIDGERALAFGRLEAIDVQPNR